MAAMVQNKTFESIFVTKLPELITFNLKRSTVNIIWSPVAPGEHMVPGPFQSLQYFIHIDTICSVHNSVHISFFKES
jgi:hypothetical protein